MFYEIVSGLLLQSLPASGSPDVTDRYRRRRDPLLILTAVLTHFMNGWRRLRAVLWHYAERSFGIDQH